MQQQPQVCYKQQSTSATESKERRILEMWAMVMPAEIRNSSAPLNTVGSSTPASGYNTKSLMSYSKSLVWYTAESTKRVSSALFYTVCMGRKSSVPVTPGACGGGARKRRTLGASLRFRLPTQQNNLVLLLTGMYSHLNIYYHSMLLSSFIASA